MKELGGKTGVLVRLDLPLVGGGTEAGPDTHMGQFSESGEKHSTLRVKQLICGSLNGMRIRQSLPQPYIHSPERDTGLLEGTVTESWSLGIVEQSPGKDCY